MKEDIYHIASGYFKGTISDSEKAILTRWLDESEENRALFRELETVWKLTGSTVQKIDVDVDAEWQRFTEARNTLPREETDKSRRLFPAVVWKIAAVVIPAVVIGSVFLLIHSRKTEWMSVVTGNHMRTVELPDGSKVWVNKNSKLTYPAKFGPDNRTVKFSGEAFFEITPDNKAFLVETGKVTVKVLGTRFNLRSFENESSSELFLKEGKVLFSKTGSPAVNITLFPGETASLTDTSAIISKTDAQPVNATAWLDRRLSFRNATLADISKNLERYFNVDIIVPPAMENCRFSGDFENPQLYDLLDVICLAIDCTYKTGDNMLIFSGAGCN